MSLSDFSGVVMGRTSFGRPATTDVRDEILSARILARAGGSEEERKRERLSEPTRSILDAAAGATQSNRVSSRCHDHWSNDSSRGAFDSSFWERLRSGADCR